MFLFFYISFSDQKELTVNQEADATLECSGSTNATVIMIRWEKPNLTLACVICFIDDQPQKDTQHELFKNRVDMTDPKWKETGNFSVSLKNVTTNDSGTYICEAGYNGQKPVLLSRVTLKVEVQGEFNFSCFLVIDVSV